MNKNYLIEDVIYIKIGGSIITYKNKPFTLRRKLLKRIAREIKKYIETNKKDRKIIIGHGSGSFGHTIAKKYNLKRGLNTYKGSNLIEDQYYVDLLNKQVYETFYNEGIPVMVFSPHSFMHYNFNKKTFEFFARPMVYAITKGIIPIVYGDNILSNKEYFYLLSTEDIFYILINKIKPSKVIFATDTLPYIKIKNKRKFLRIIYKEILLALRQQDQDKLYRYDVTGNMLTKLRIAYDIFNKTKAPVYIVDALKKNSIKNALMYGKGKYVCKVVL